jgi:copper chaperone NosL
MRYVVLALIFWAACTPRHDARETAQLQAEAIGHAECAACGMLVSHQPAPRAQVVHRDGARKHFCSLSDLAHYMEAPSPHGAITRTFVEAMEPEADIADMSTAKRPWRNAEELWYLVGVERRAVMGRPVMSYQTADDARKAAEAFGGHVVSWHELPARLTGRLGQWEDEE